MRRKSGVLLPVTSLMGEYGIGGFGRSAYAFIDFIAGMGFSVWQILPVTTIGLGNSPYSGISAFAGSFLLIDVDEIPSRLLPCDEKNSAKYGGSCYRADYAFAAENKKRLLKLAYSRLSAEDKEEIAAFKENNAYWLEGYALYSYYKEINSGKSFIEWDNRYKFVTRADITARNLTLSEETGYYYFEQYLFFKQWNALKKYAAERGVEIFGDMPIYVAHDSVDVWENPKNFRLDADLMPTRVAGVPPDYFAADGQLWGNPLYDYKKMEKDGFDWWIKRIKHGLSMYDIVRIDHFRGLWKYWAVPAGAKTAKEGEWVDGPQMKLWRELKKTVPNPKIVAEDLGIIDDGVREYLKSCGFPGMRVFQFAFDGLPKNPHLPYNYEKNTVAYTATHDNNTTLGWLYEMDNSARERVLSYISVNAGWGQGGGQSPSVRAVIKEIIAGVSELAIIPYQDLCGYGADTRMNVPGVPEGNWEYRITYETFEQTDYHFILGLNRKYGRTDK